MLPTILGINSYAIAAALGFASFILVFVLTLDLRLKINKREVSNMIIVMIGAIGIGLFLAWFLDGLFKIPDNGGLRLWINDDNGFRLLGITWYGMLIGGLGGLALLHLVLNKIFIKKKGKLLFETNKITYLSVAAPAMALAHFWGRIGCFLMGCCHGMVSNIGWVYPQRRHYRSDGSYFYAYPFGPHPRFPVQLVEAGVLLVIFAVLFSLLFIKNKKIERFAKAFNIYIYLAVYAVTRFILEFFRGDLRGGLFAFMGLSPGQFVSICLFIFVSVMVVIEVVRGQRSKGEFHNSQCSQNLID